MKYFILLAAALFTLTSCTTKKLTAHGLIKINPLYNQPFVCAEHAIEKMGIGDVYGRDCMVTKFEKVDNKKWQRMHSSKGLKNSDWFSWRANILAPFDGKVSRLNINNKTNEPGIPIKSRASAIFFTSNDDLNVVYGHIKRTND